MRCEVELSCGKRRFLPPGEFSSTNYRYSIQRDNSSSEFQRFISALRIRLGGSVGKLEKISRRGRRKSLGQDIKEAKKAIHTGFSVSAGLVGYLPSIDKGYWRAHSAARLDLNIAGEAPSKASTYIIRPTNRTSTFASFSSKPYKEQESLPITR
ncbi:hypothetical protein B9Z19DRAFT_51848 [Tuber borchii]|uniref:Uncharacterized protein n=1 Tax=Tuber borchii TaxID=42251 RepID=A0A2T7A738_TUBBO|nr:hypothetical protein B9Z19DRAFT_51848 [Tuber borchii]